MTGPGPDEIIHQALRLQIMAALRRAPEGDPPDFPRLKRITGASDGNLGRQLKTLAEAGYITLIKDTHRKRPRTRAELTLAGAAAFDRHVAYLKSLLPGMG